MNREIFNEFDIHWKWMWMNCECCAVRVCTLAMCKPFSFAQTQSNMLTGKMQYVLNYSIHTPSLIERCLKHTAETYCYIVSAHPVFIRWCWCWFIDLTARGAFPIHTHSLHHHPRLILMSDALHTTDHCRMWKPGLANWTSNTMTDKFNSFLVPNIEICN